MWDELIKARTKEEGKSWNVLRYEVDDIKSLMESLQIEVTLLKNWF